MTEMCTHTHTNREHMPGGALLHSPAASTPDNPLKQASTQLPFPFQAPLGRVDQIAPAMSYVGVPLVSSSQGCLIQKQPYEQEACHMPILPELAFKD